MKQCCTCKEEKPLDAFDRDCKAKDGRHGMCKECRRPGKKRWREANRDVLYEYYLNHKEYFREAGRRSYKKRKEATHASTSA